MFSNKRWLLILLVEALILAAWHGSVSIRPAHAEAAMNATIPDSGSLTDPSGAPKQGQFDFTFTLYAASTCRASCIEFSIGFGWLRRIGL
jgi:hypothetical protein